MMHHATAHLENGASAEGLFARFTVGNLLCVALSDGYIATPAAILAPEVSAAELGPFLAAHGEDIDALTTPVTCLIVDMPDGCRLLVDAGLGTVPGPSGHASPTVGRLKEALAAADIDPGSVEHVLVSHIHPDHIGGLFDADGRPNFINADIYVPKEDAAFWAGDDPDLSGTMMPPPLQAGTIATAKRFLALAADRMKLFAAGDELMAGIGSMILPGHTPGQVGFLFDAGTDKLFYSADAAGHPHVSVEQPDWRFAFDTDAALAIRTRKHLIALLAERGWVTYTPHFSWPGVGRFGHTASGIRWRPIR